AGRDGQRTMAAAGTLFATPAIALADLDGDCIPEIILQTNGALNVWRGDGSTFPGWPVSVPGTMLFTAPVVDDVDGDGLPDIVVVTSTGQNSTGQVWVFYLASSVVQWNGATRPTTFVNSTSIRAIISATDVAHVGIFQIAVLTPSPGGGVSGALSFAVRNPLTSGFTDPTI